MKTESLPAHKLFSKRMVSQIDTDSPPALPPVIAVRPMLMLTGFLGAGKTTLLRSLLNELTTRGHLADVILNDRENALIDKEALQDDAVSLAALYW